MPRNHRSRRDNAVQNSGTSPASRGRNELRIIGGRWRGRKLRFPSAEGLRPTPDRVRETLFNWLAPSIRGARCLDLFAGSGALGLEALSRGAAEVVFVERAPLVARHLREALGLLAADGGRVVQADAAAFLAGPAQPFDVVFLDPPFGADLVPAMLARLVAAGWLAPGARVYVEQPAARGAPAWPAPLVAHRSGQAGEVGYHLGLMPAGSEA
jgi:16S rRNA (guanine966-N2)-methyltransferase